MNGYLKRRGAEFLPGRSQITHIDDKEYSTGMAFSIIKLLPGESYTSTGDNESALLQLSGDLEAAVEGQRFRNRRDSLFTELPFALHVPSGVRFEIQARSEMECALIETANPLSFPPKVYTPDKVQNEHRGKGMLEDTAYRYVRTIFDNNNSHKDAQLVLGEVVNFPGRWSSYPPHHHPHPEIYHYRFADPRGYGHGEMGEDIYKIRSGDTLLILDGKDHPQCAAPGYAMYYLWAIRHLPHIRYTVPEFTKDHIWMLNV